MTRLAALALLLSVLLAGCEDRSFQQRWTLVACLQKCKDGDAACISACSTLWKGDCK